MSLKLNSSGGGSVTLLEPATASNRTLNLPNVDGTVITTADSGTVSSTMIAAAAVTPAKLSQPLTLATAQATTSGTSIDFTGIPSWVRRITVILNGVSTNGTSIPQIQLGDSGGVETSGYAGAASSEVTGSTTIVNLSGSGFALLGSSSAASVLLTGSVVLTAIDITTNTWICAGLLVRADAAGMHRTGGAKTLSATLDRIRLTTVNGTDTFDAGSVNIMYEG